MKFKKVLACLLAAVMTVSLGLTVGPQEAVKADISSKFIQLDGDGTQESPFLIKSAADLAVLRDYTNQTSEGTTGKYFKLTRDINLGDYCGEGRGDWTPIGNSSYPFRGNFDGDNHTI